MLFLPSFLPSAIYARVEDRRLDDGEHPVFTRAMLVDCRPILLLLPDVVLVDVSRGHRVRDCDGDDRS